MPTNYFFQLFVAIGFVLMWSSGFIGARLGTDESNSMTVLMWRFLVASTILSCWWLLKKKKKISAKQYIQQMIIGLLTQGGYIYFVFLSIENGVSAGTSSLITALQPIFLALLAGPILKERTTKKQWIGLLLGIIGVSLVVYNDLDLSNDVSFWAYCLSFFAMISLVMGTLLEKGMKTSVPLSDALPIQTFITACLFTFLATLTGNGVPPKTFDFWLAVFWLAGLSTIGGYGFYWLNLTLGSVSRVSSLLYLIPPVTLLWAFFMFGDPISFLTIFGMLLCLIGVWINQTEGSDVDG